MFGVLVWDTDEGVTVSGEMDVYQPFDSYESALEFDTQFSEENPGKSTAIVNLLGAKPMQYSLIINKYAILNGWDAETQVLRDEFAKLLEQLDALDPNTFCSATILGKDEAIALSKAVDRDGTWPIGSKLANARRSGNLYAPPVIEEWLKTNPVQRIVDNYDPMHGLIQAAKKLAEDECPEAFAMAETLAVEALRLRQESK